MEIISIGHVDMEKEIFDPYRWVSSAIVLLDVDGLEPIGELMFHYPVCKADRVSGTSEPSSLASDVGRDPCVSLVPSSVVPVHPGIIAVEPGWRTPS
jgi:hypothetical protein